MKKSTITIIAALCIALVASLAYQNRTTLFPSKTEKEEDPFKQWVIAENVTGTPVVPPGTFVGVGDEVYLVTEVTMVNAVQATKDARAAASAERKEKAKELIIFGDKIPIAGAEAKKEAVISTTLKFNIYGTKVR